MEGIRGWAASVIAAAILAGVVEFALPRGNLEKTGKVLLSLFMLVSFLSPAVGLITEPNQIKSGLDELLEEYEAQEALEQTVAQTLEREIVSSVSAFAAEEGIAVSDVEARVSVGKDNIITVSRIEIVMNGAADSVRKLDDYCVNSFSIHPTIVTQESTWISEEGRNAKTHENEAD